MLYRLVHVKKEKAVKGDPLSLVATNSPVPKWKDLWLGFYFPSYKCLFE